MNESGKACKNRHSIVDVYMIKSNVIVFESDWNSEYAIKFKGKETEGINTLTFGRVMCEDDEIDEEMRTRSNNN